MTTRNAQAAPMRWFACLLPAACCLLPAAADDPPVPQAAKEVASSFGAIHCIGCHSSPLAGYVAPTGWVRWNFAASG